MGVSKNREKASEWGETYFYEDDFKSYFDWVNFNMEAMTWQGRYQKDFERFWVLFFLEGQSLKQIIDRFEFVIFHSSIGSLANWFIWLRNRLIVFSFLKKNMTVIQLSKQTDLSLGEVSSILRDYLLEHNPYLNEKLSNIFQITNIMSDRIDLNYDELKKLLSSNLEINSLSNSGSMNSLEVTLYPEWRELLEKIEQKLYHHKFRLEKIKLNMRLKERFVIVRDLFVMGGISFLIIFLIQKANKEWDRGLIDKISIYEPQLKWLDKKLHFKEKEKILDKDLTKLPVELETPNRDVFDNIATGDSDDTRYDVESEVILTSWDKLPKDFNIADLEISDYEENRVTGYRDSRYGYTKVYRVMMKTVDSFQTKNRLDRLLKKYNVTRVDNVEPGKDVPGGAYYNIYVPRVYLKDFMAKIMEMGDAVLYESRTRTGKNPIDQNKVFIWVKTI